MAKHQHIAVALSGGGHRASLFGLGALVYLMEAGKGPEIANIASVSGGSLTNGYVGLHCDLTSVSPVSFEEHAQQLAQRIARGGTVWASPLTWAYLALLASPLVVALACWWFELTGSVSATFLVALVVVGVLAKLRSRVAAAAFDHALFNGRKLAEVHSTVDHVICAADLQSAQHAYFSARFVYSYYLGWGKPGALRLSRAVQASACLPGAFNPVAWSTADHGFNAPDYRRFLLTDGGVYDNMGTEWTVRLHDRLRSGVKHSPATMPEPLPSDVDEFVIVNASAPQEGVKSQRLVRLPVIGEIVTLLSANSVLYGQSTAVRRRWLDLRFRTTRAQFNDSDGPLDGALVQINTSPYEWPAKFHGTDELGTRAHAARAFLDADATTEDDWKRAVSANKVVKTKLSRIPVDRAAWLLRHGYVLAMVNAHITLGYDLLPVPPLSRFEAWLT